MRTSSGLGSMLNKILPSLSERSAFAKEICAAVEQATMERASAVRSRARRVGRMSACGMGVPLRCLTVLRSSLDQRAARHPWPVRAKFAATCTSQWRR